MIRIRNSRVTACISLAACSVVPCLLGCHDSPALPPAQLEGDFLTYAASEDVELCPGTLVQTERWMLAVAERLGIDPQDIRKTTYYIVDEDLLASECGKAGAHCTRREEDDGIVIFSTELTNKHELVHALHLSSWPDRQQILQEGLACGFDDRSPQSSLAPAADILDAAIEDDARTGNNVTRVVGGFFVSWFYRTYGAQNLVDFWATSSSPTTAAEFRRDFEQVTGDVLASVFPAADTLGCPLVTCPGVPRAWVNDVWTTNSPDGCEDDSVAGSVGPDSYLVIRTDLLEIAVGGDYEIAVAAGASPGVQITPCDVPCEGIGIESGVVETHNLWPGLYRVETAQWKADAPTYQVTVKPVADMPP